MHVRGFTRHTSSGVADSTRSTYAGLIGKIPYLQDRGLAMAVHFPFGQLGGSSLY
jgi:glycogen operon protein